MIQRLVIPLVLIKQRCGDCFLVGGLTEAPAWTIGKDLLNHGDNCIHTLILCKYKACRDLGDLYTSLSKTCTDFDILCIYLESVVVLVRLLKMETQLAHKDRLYILVLVIFLVFIIH